LSETTDDVVELHWGKTGRRVMSAMFMAWSCYPDVGHDLIIDHVLLFREWVDELARDLRAHRVIFVGVFCSSSEELGHGTRGLLSTERPQVRFAIDLYGAFPVKRTFAIKSENLSRQNIRRERLDFVFKPRLTNFRSSGRINGAPCPRC